MEKQEYIQLYTDGSTKTNPGTGSWAAIIIDQNAKTEEILTKTYKLTTNNRMEMLGIIESLAYIHQKYFNTCTSKMVRVEVFSDSKYVIDSITSYMPKWKKNGWRTTCGKPVKNKDILLKADNLLGNMEIIFNWVKGHSDCAYNNRCDILAKDALNSRKMFHDKEYELDKSEDMLYNFSTMMEDE